MTTDQPRFTAMATPHLYYHSPCFDGICSAAIISEFGVQSLQWREPTLHPVNYNVRPSWVLSELGRPNAVVDFLYHPDADLWADHHVSAFVTEELRHHFESRRSDMLLYDDQAPSCARVLWKHARPALIHRQDQFDELEHWASKIDSASYDSVEEAIFSDRPAMKISIGLGVARSAPHSRRLVQLLRSRSLDEIASMAEVDGPYQEARRRIEAGMSRLRASLRPEGRGVVSFDVDSAGVMISRYAPFLFCPDADYSVGIVRAPSSAKITAMQNPWKRNDGAALGPMFRSLGGGGHRRVASLVLDGDRVADAPLILRDVIHSIESEVSATEKRISR